MKDEKLFNNFNNKFFKESTKFLKQINLDYYYSELCHFQPISVYYNNKDLIVTTNLFSKISVRKTIVDTLKEINFKRKDNKWTTKIVVAFIEEVIQLYKIADDIEFNKEKEVISTRYNVKSNRLKTQVALFINNFKNNKDHFHLEEYFDDIEFCLWKYNTLDKIQLDIENNKISNIDLNILKQLNIIE